MSQSHLASWGIADVVVEHRAATQDEIDLAESCRINVLTGAEIGIPGLRIDRFFYPAEEEDQDGKAQAQKART